MDTLPEEKQVVELLSKLKASGTYPKDMLYSRRQQFIRQVASAGLGMSVGIGLKHTAKGSQSAGTTATTVTGKIIETVLIAAIIVEVGTTAYIYRQKIADFFKSFIGPESSETIQRPINNSSLSEPIILPTLTVHPTSETPSATTSPLETVLPSAVQQNSNNNTNNNSNSTIATPKPTDNNGNRYGQTPRPEQTKDNNSGTNNNGNGNK